MIAWTRANLFSSPGNALLTLFGLALAWTIFAPLVDWAVLRAVWTGSDRTACAVPDAGACWPYIGARLGQIVYGFYDAAERWRVNIVFASGALGLAWLMLPGMPSKRLVGALMLTAFPILSFVLLTGMVQASRRADGAVGRLYADASGRGDGRRDFASHRNRARARAAFGPAGHQVGGDHLHRGDPGRSPHHHPLHGVEHAAAVPSGRRDV